MKSGESSSRFLRIIVWGGRHVSRSQLNSGVRPTNRLWETNKQLYELIVRDFVGHRDGRFLALANA